MYRVDGDLRLLDVADNMEWRIGLADAEGYGELTSGGVLDWLEYPQTDPTPPETDCAPAISIMDAPHFPKNSKNLLIQDRNIRAAYRDGIINRFERETVRCN